MNITTTAQQTDKQTAGRLTRLRERVRSSIRLRFGLTFSLLVLVLLISTAVSWLSYTTLNAGGDTAITQQTAVAQLSVNAQHNLLTARANEHNYQTNTTLTNEEARAQYLTPLISNIAQIRQRGIELKLLLEESGGTAAEITLLDGLMTAADQYEASFLSLVEAIEADPTADITTQQTALDTAAQTISDVLNTLGENSASRAATTWERTQLLNQLSTTSTILILLTSTLITLFLGVRLTRGVARPIYKLSQTTGRFLNEQIFEPTAAPRQPDELHTLIQHINIALGRDAERAAAAQQLQTQFQAGITTLQQTIAQAAQGDFSAQLPTDNDLIYEIGQSFNQLMVELQKINTDMGQSAGQLDKATHALHTTISGLTEKTTAQIAHLKQHAAAMHTFTEQIKADAQTLHGSATASNDVRQIGRVSHGTAQQIEASMERLRQQTQETAKRVKRLGESSQEISEIGELLRQIADQLALLALNASIKAKGGEATQLKQEIEQMAEQASTSAATVGTLIETLQRETAQVITAVEITTAEVVTSSTLTQEMTQRLDHLQTDSEAVASSLKTHFHERQKQAQEARQLASQLTQIAQLIEKNHGRTQKLTAAINGMKQLTRSLSKTAAQFQPKETNLS